LHAAVVFQSADPIFLGDTSILRPSKLFVFV
jgi:hypothetical protein